MMFENGGASIDRVFVCPHLPDDLCSCRKPKLGLLEQAASFLNVPISEAVVIGDNAADIDLALRAGVLGLHVKSGVGYAPTITVPSFSGPLEAVNWLLSSSPLQRKRLTDETYEG
jgi:histidinol phosphatase-like enzyme